MNLFMFRPELPGTKCIKRKKKTPKNFNIRTVYRNMRRDGQGALSG